MMRLTELSLIDAALPLGVAILARGRADGRMLRAWCLVVLAAIVAHITLEGLYWQMAAAYVACLLLLLVVFTPSRWSAVFLRSAGALAVLLLFATTAALIVLPKFRLPPPTGPYAIGTRILHFEDSSRPDPAFASGHRELMVQVWYPAEASHALVATYRRAAETTWLSSYDAVLATHSHLDAPLLFAGRPFPVLLFNPAWEGQRTQNTFETENLASHGFVVFAIDHTHNSEPVAFPDGTILRSSQIRDIEDFTGVSYQAQVDYGDAEARIQAQDDRFVLDTVTNLAGDSSSPWHQSLDFSRVGVFGHSFGGAVSVEAALQDPRILSAIDMDGWIFGELWRSNLDKPLMLIYEDGFSPSPAVLQAGLRSSDRNRRLVTQLDIADLANLNRTLSTCGGYLLSIAGSGHFNFSDRALYSPLRRLTEAGPISPERAHRIVNDYTLAFFTQTLNRAPAPLLHEAAPYPEVHFEDHPRQQDCTAGPEANSTEKAASR